MAPSRRGGVLMSIAAELANAASHHAEPSKQEAENVDLRLQRIIESAAHLLPAQGPITVFIHHNTLHAFEHLPFEQGVEKGARVFGCQPYLSEDRYREELRRGRIRFAELQEVLEENLAARAS